MNETDAIDVEAVDDELGKRALALAILSCGLIDYARRVMLAVSLDLAAPILVSELNLEDDDPGLTGALLAAGLIEDSATSFNSLGTASWSVKSSYIQHSSSFAIYADSIGFSKADFAALAQDSAIPDSVKRAVSSDLGAFADSMSPAALRSLAAFAVDDRAAVGAQGLRMMATASVPSDLLVRLIALELDALDTGDLLSVLRLMPERYKKLASTGSHTLLPNTPEDIRLADRLVTVGQVSSRDSAPSGSQFRVNLKRRL